jgi:hypothetical protein
MAARLNLAVLFHRQDTILAPRAYNSPHHERDDLTLGGEVVGVFISGRRKVVPS